MPSWLFLMGVWGAVGGIVTGGEKIQLCGQESAGDVTVRAFGKCSVG